MSTRPFPSLRWQRLPYAFVLLSHPFSPLQSVAAYIPPPAPSEPAQSTIPDPSAALRPSSGQAAAVYRTTVTLRTPADWARLEDLGVVTLEEKAAQERATDQQKNTDQESARSVPFRSSVAVILADADQLAALARLRFEPRSTDELGVLVMAHTQAKPWPVAGSRR